LLSEPWLASSRILILQPRRIAARSVANRMASLLGEDVGATVGYHVRLERRVSARTRIEVLTEGILTRRLANDPTLDNVSLVIFDEFHERSVHGDVALAFSRRIQKTVREDLRILLMSATLDTPGLSPSLGDIAHVASAGRLFPVDVRYAREDAPRGRDPSPMVVSAIRRALVTEKGDVLVFLPGAPEIRRVVEAVQREARANGDSIDVIPLHGELTLEAQQRAIVPGPRRRVVVATNIAETSLTIEGVRVVVDSGLVRVARFDSGLGMSRILTERVSKANADQRAGRAGRLGPGVVFRLWTEQTHGALVPALRPEIETADLVPLALDLAAFGEPDEALEWLTPPAERPLRGAREVLRGLQALDASHRLTQHGRALVALGVHPRLGHLLIEGRKSGESKLASEVAAAIETGGRGERSEPAEKTSDITSLVESLHHGSPGRVSHLQEIALFFEARLSDGDPSEGREARHRAKAPARHPPADDAIGRLVALAFPERIARRRPGSRARYQLTSGRGARLSDGDPLSAHEWLAVAHLDIGPSGVAGRSNDSRIRLAAPLEVANMESVAGTLLTQNRVVEWNGETGALIARTEKRLGAIVLEARDLGDATRSGENDSEFLAERIAVLCRAVQSEGLGILEFDERTERLRDRVRALSAWGRAEFPDLSDTALLANVELWLGPLIALGDVAIRRREDFARLDHLAALRTLVPPAALRALDDLAPAAIEVPTGSKITLDYRAAAAGGAPVLAVRLQELFGWTDTPTVNHGRTRVTLSLLSPGGKPVQTTQDLRSFWTNAYAEVRKEMRARYPRHSWPEDPWTAPPIRGALRRRP
jgi:ATP-dependent helicase HrpB